MALQKIEQMNAEYGNGKTNASGDGDGPATDVGWSMKGNQRRELGRVGNDHNPPKNHHYKK